MAAVAKKDAKEVKQYNYAWTGKDKAGKIIKGEVRAQGESSVAANLRRQGIQGQKIKKVSQRGGKKITEKDLTVFTRQLAVMMKAGVPLLQAFDIVGRGHSNPSVAKLLLDIKTDVETGSSLATAFRRYPLYFDFGVDVEVRDVPHLHNMLGALRVADAVESFDRVREAESAVH